MDLIVIDCEGTLLDCEALRARVLSEALAGLGAWVNRATIAEALPGRSLPEAALAVAARRGIVLPPGFGARCDYALKARAVGQVRPSPGIGRVLDMARVPVCVTSPSDLSVVRALLRAAGLGALVSDLVLPDPGLSHAPAPDRLLKIAARMDTDPARILVIDDSPAAMVAALSAGMSTLLYTAKAPAEVHAAWIQTGTLGHWDDFPHGLLWPEATARVC